MTNLIGWLIFGLRLVKCYSPIWLKCKWQQRFCATELSLHESSAFVSSYEHIFSFWIFFLQLQAVKMMGSRTLIFSYPAKVGQPFFTLWSIQNVLWSIEQRHEIDDPNFGNSYNANVPFLNSLKTSNFWLHLKFSGGIKTRLIAYFEHTKLVSALITFIKHFLAGKPLTPWTEWHRSMYLL